MKILFYADTVFGYGGVQRVLSVVAKSLAAENGKGVGLSNKVDILTIDNDSHVDIYGYKQTPITFKYISYHTPHDLQYYCCKAASMAYKKWLPHNSLTSCLYARSFFMPRYKRMLIDAINSGGYDVVIGVHAFLSLHLASIRKHLKAKAVIGWMHNSYYALFEKERPYLPGLRQFFADMMMRLDDVVVLTQSDADNFKSHLGISAKVIHNPLTLVPQGKGNAGNKKFLAIGRFSPLHKSFDILLNAFALFARSNSQWTLEIVGEGEEEGMLRDIISRNNLGERVQISPFTPHIQNHYASASIFVLSSRWEGQPLVLVEAMSHALPVISSDIPVSCEFLEGSGAGILFKSEDPESLSYAMTRMASDEQTLKAMSETALQYAKHFNPDNISKQWMELLSAPSLEISPRLI